ncbi:MAG: ABC transporter permease subunit [Geminicoccaceae bacterium]|nr:ABC transporter permease subunit [Geminicoccaceae bacterium]
MRGLAAAYGRGLAGAVVLLAALWMLALILLPQLVMVERSLWSTERPEGAYAVTAQIDALYQDVTLLGMDEAAAQGAERARIAAEIEAKQAEIARLETEELAPRKVYGFQNYTRMRGLHLYIFARTILYAVLVTLLALAACYPIAYAVATKEGKGAARLMLLLVIPYAINELLRVYAWLMILDYQGVINSLLAALGLVSFKDRTWIPFLEWPASVFLAMVYAYILFMVFPIYNTIETLDKNQIEAARDLGASTVMIHRRVVIPHAKPGIAVGCIMTFMLSAGSYAVPQIMTRGQGGDWFSQLVYRQFFEANNWNIGAAYAFALLLACLAFVFLVMRLFGVGIRDIVE